MTDRASQLSPRDLLWFLISPLTGLLVNPIAVVRTLAACHVLRRGRWNDHNGFASSPALLKTFYWAQALNFEKYGRQGTSPLLGSGAFPVARLWYQSTIAVSLDCRLGGVVTCMIGMTGWILTHGFWLRDPAVSSGKLIFLVAMAGVTTNFYGNVFGRQNYNIYGWAVFPAIVHGVIAADVWAVAGWTTLASVFSVTVVSMTAPLWVLAACYRHEFWGLAALVPAATVVLNRVRVPAASPKARVGRDFKWLLTSIGAIRRSRYRRRRYVWQSLALASVLGIVPVAMIARGASGYGLGAPVLAALTLVPIAGFVLAETRLFRWADAQSYLFAFLTISTGTTLAAWDPVVLTAWWIANSNSAVGRVLFNFDKDVSRSWGPAAKPFDVRPVRDAIDDLLSVVPSGSRVWLACDDPCDEYNRIFDGYSDLFQLAHFCANTKDVLLTPDWYAVMDHNVNLSAPPIWGRSPEDAIRNAERVAADFILVYERPDEHLHSDFERAGWTSLNRLDWQSCARYLEGSALFSTGWVTWHLFSRSASDRTGNA